jgi:Tat protein secretion system quality control protein TatD with DNase activity
MDIQQAVFEKTVDLAQNIVPVVIHCVAVQEVIKPRNDYISVPMIIHGFSKK